LTARPNAVAYPESVQIVTTRPRVSATPGLVTLNSSPSGPLTVSTVESWAISSMKARRLEVAFDLPSTSANTDTTTRAAGNSASAPKKVSAAAASMPRCRRNPCHARMAAYPHIARGMPRLVC
jgi:hypothetical protein